MTLEEYLATSKTTITEFAKQLGIDRTSLSRYLSRERPYDVDLCINTEKLTGGQVRCEDLRPDVDWAFIRAPNVEANTPAIPTIGTVLQNDNLPPMVACDEFTAQFSEHGDRAWAHRLLARHEAGKRLPGRAVELARASIKRAR